MDNKKMISKVKAYINENKYLKMSLIIFAVVSMIVVTRLAIQEKKAAVVKDFRVSITFKDKTKRLINAEYVKSEVRNMLGYNVDRIKLADLDLQRIEEILENNDYIEDVVVYLDGRNVLRAELRQKNPIIRVSAKEQSFYLDDKGDYLSLSPVAAVRVPVVTGEIETFDANYKLADEPSQFQEIFELAQKINNDEFLTALIEQVHIEKNGEFLLIPKIGKERIMLGSIYDLDEKMYDLKVFYKEGLTRVGWGKFAYLDLKNKDQVVGTRN